MQPIAFCNRCRGMKVGWNGHYILHCLVCEEWFSKSFKFLVLTAILSSFLFAFPVATGRSMTDLATEPLAQPALQAATADPAVAAEKSVAAVEALLARYGVEKDQLGRVAQAIVTSSKKYRLDPRLVASIVIVESRANPYAVSEADSMGVMQIHLGTWAEVVDRENVNLFRVEENVDFGVRLLRSYIATNGLWEGVARYKGVTDAPESRIAADEYVQKVMRIYGVLPVDPPPDPGPVEPVSASPVEADQPVS